MSRRYGPRADASVMRCPRCLERWDPDYVALDAEHAECRACSLVVALLGLVVPEWASDGVASRLDRVGPVPPLGDVALSESLVPLTIEARGRDGAREKRAFRKPVTLPLPRIARFVPAASFAWERDARAGQKWLVATALVCAVSDDEGATGPSLEVGSWDAARYVAARFEVVRRRLKEPRGAYR
jgi:hypothetical protein